MLESAQAVAAEAEIQANVVADVEPLPAAEQSAQAVARS
jgi:hypothetical protein